MSLYILIFYLFPACDNQRYGFNCSSHCNCPSNAHKSCDTGFGKCFCLPGWQGDNCDKSKYPSHAHKSCDTGFGKCFCLPGLHGDNCDKSKYPSHAHKSCDTGFGKCFCLLGGREIIATKVSILDTPTSHVTRGSAGASVFPDGMEIIATKGKYPSHAHKSCDTGFRKCFCLPGWQGR